MKELTVALLQMDAELDNKEGNIAKAVSYIKEAAEKGAKFICLPETFVTGYNLDYYGDRIYEMAEPIEGPTCTALKEAAKENGIYVIAGIPTKESADAPTYNSAVIIDDEGNLIGTYAKNHLFAGECDVFARKGEYPVFDTKYGKIGVMICADNNHPETARMLALGGAHLVFMPAAWRVQESDIWPLLIRTHALESNIFILAANICKKMPDLYLFGHSMIANPRGQEIAVGSEDKEELIVATIDLDEVENYRATMPSLKDRHPEDYGRFTEPLKDSY